MSYIYLPENVSKARKREAENARKNRMEIVREYSRGKVSRRDLIKWGLITSGGVLAPIHGLNPFVTSAYADGGSSNIPTGAPRSPFFGVQAFTQPMLRFDVLPRLPVPAVVDATHPHPLSPVPTAGSNQTLQAVDPALGGGFGPIEGRPPGAVWSHQQFNILPPNVAVEASVEGAKANGFYNPGIPSSLNSGVDPTTSVNPRFHPNLPDQGPLALWTYNGTFPPKLMQVRYGDPVLFRLHNKLPVNVAQNGGFGAAYAFPPTSTTGTTARKTTASLAPISSPISSTIITIRSCWRGVTASTRMPPIQEPEAPQITAASIRFRAIGMKP